MDPIIGAEYPEKVIPLINAATKNIDIISYDWRWYANQPTHPVQRVNVALVNASKRGVIIRALLNKNDLVKLLVSVGIRAKTLTDKRTLHSKIMLIDSHILIIGSHNITRNAFSHNVEASVAVPLGESDTRFTQFFENLYNI